MVLSRGEIVFYGDIEDAIEFYKSPLYTKAVTYGV
jgi:ABC-type polysaccharide/polyol phosphate transport system ATPase subunit